MKTNALLLLLVAGCNNLPLNIEQLPGSIDLGTPSIDLLVATSTPVSCGVRGGQVCPVGYFCNYASECGITDNGGLCKPIPSDCNDSNAKQPQCGCDHVSYASPCLRERAGAALLHEGNCSACEEQYGKCHYSDAVVVMCDPHSSEVHSLSASCGGLGAICCVPFWN